jgi:uncharacterized membrane protein YbhN (UPF0104 family)
VLVVWVTSVAAWRNYLYSFTGAMPAWREAFRQIGLLLVGKYIPGGIFGFVARIYDEASAQRGPLLAAGVVEQLVGAAMATMLGALCYLAGWYRQPAWLLLIVLLPPLAVVGTQLFAMVLRHSSRLHRRIPVFPPWSRPQLLVAALLSLLQQISWALAVGLLAMHLFGLDLLSAIGVAGAFGLAVGAGVLVVVSPGGIGVREGAMTALAATWMGFDSALLLAALLRVVGVGLDLLAGSLVLVVGKRKPSGSEET